jgi:magnesium chelatase family protein
MGAPVPLFSGDKVVSWPDGYTTEAYMMFVNDQPTAATLVALAPQELVQAPPGEASAPIALRVAAARERSLARQGCLNEALAGQRIDTHCALGDPVAQFLTSAATRLAWSGRSIHRCLKVARSIADLAGSDQIALAHVAEAVQYRRGLMAA